MSGVRNTLSNLITKLAIYPLAFISSVLVARILGPTDRGAYAFLLLLSGMATAIFTFGFHSGARYQISSKASTFKEVWFTVVIMGIITGILIGLLVDLFWITGLFGNVGKKISIYQMMIVKITIIFATVNAYLQRILIGQNHFVLINKLSIVAGFLAPGLLVLAVVFLGLRIDGSVVANMLVQVFWVSAFIIFILRKYPVKPKVDFELVKRSYKYGIKAWVGDVATVANVRFDQFFLGATTATSGLGLYSIAVNLSELLWIVPDSVSNVLYNKVAGETSGDNSAHFTARIHRIVFFVTLLAVIGFILFGYWLIIWAYGISFEKSYIALVLLMPGTLFYISQKISSKLFSKSHNVIKSSTTAVVSSVISISLCLVFIPLMGFWGAAIATSIAYTASAFLAFRYFKKDYGISIKEMLLIKKSDLTWLKSILLAARKPKTMLHP